MRKTKTRRLLEFYHSLGGDCVFDKQTFRISLLLYGGEWLDNISEEELDRRIDNYRKNMTRRPGYDLTAIFLISLIAPPLIALWRTNNFNRFSSGIIKFLTFTWLLMLSVFFFGKILVVNLLFYINYCLFVAVLSNISTKLEMTEMFFKKLGLVKS